MVRGGEELTLIDCWKNIPGLIDIANVCNEIQDKYYLLVINKFLSDRDVHIIRKFSGDAAKSFPDEYFDWVYIDADHTFDGLTNDLKSWWPKLRSGGIFSGHDFLNGYYMETFFGVKDAVEKFALEKNKRIYTIQEPFPSWYFLK